MHTGTWYFNADPLELGRAPHVVRQHCQSAGVPAEVAAIAADLTQELVSNAGQHTQSRLIEVDVTVGPRDVSVGVTDEDPSTAAAVIDAGSCDPHEHGLGRVVAAAKEWGLHRPAAGRKTVWFRLAAE